MTLEEQLLANHYKNENGCWLTNFAKIKGLKMLASTTNGDAGLAKWCGRKIYFYLNDRLGRFFVEPA